MEQERQQQQQKQEQGGRATHATSTGTRVSAMAGAAAAEIDLLEAPLSLRQTCASVLTRYINSEQEHRRTINQTVSSASSASAPASARPVIVIDDDDEGEVEWIPPPASQTEPAVGSKRPVSMRPLDSADTDDLPFRLPLHAQLPPRSWPEHCRFCHNLSYFSALFVADCTDAPLLEMMGQGAAVRSPEDIGSAATDTGRLLCCTRCLAQFLSHRRQQAATGQSRSSKMARLSASTSAQRPVTSWKEAGVLPTPDDNQRAFIERFEASLRDEADSWQLAYLGQRHSDSELNEGLAIAKAVRLRQSDDSSMTT